MSIASLFKHVLKCQGVNVCKMFLVVNSYTARIISFLAFVHSLNGVSQNIVIDNTGSIKIVSRFEKALEEIDEKELYLIINDNNFKVIEKSFNNGVTHYLLKTETISPEIHIDLSFKNGSIFAISQIAVSICETSAFHNNLILEKSASAFKRLCVGGVINNEISSNTNLKYKCKNETSNYVNTKMLNFEPTGNSQIKMTSLDLFLFSDQRYIVSNHDLITFDNNNINGMVQVFLEDCKNNGIDFPSNHVKIAFEKLPEGVLGLSYGMYNDSLIDIRIDRLNWSKSSSSKRWYVLYHELGHDLLNFEHGKGGRMMNPIADRGYTWEEFWRDRSVMFEEYYLD